MSLSIKEAQVLRDLGQQYMEIASHPIQQEKLKLWKALNRNAMVRPMVCIDQLPWNELEGANDLACRIADPYWRELELKLRETRDAAKANNVNLEYILKDISTVRFDPSRLGKWAEIAMRVVEDW